MSIAASGSARRTASTGSASTRPSISAAASDPSLRVKGLRVFYGGPPGVHVDVRGIELKLERPGFGFRGSVSMTTGADPNGVSDPSD
jgi:hypothetical protein